MNQSKIIFGVATLIGLFLFNQTRPLFLKIVLVLITIFSGLSFFDNYVNIDIPFISFGIIVFGFTIWCGLKGKWTSMLVGLFSFVSFTWSILNLQHWGSVQFSMLIPIGLYIRALFKKSEFKNELSILTALVGFELSEFVLFITRIFN